MKDSQVESVTNEATEEPVAAQSGQVESAEVTGVETSLAAEEAGAEAESCDVAHDGPAETAPVEGEQTTEGAGADESLANNLEGGSGKPSARHVDGPTAHLVVFALGDEQYGVGIDAVDSIIRPQSITAVPRAPDFVEGVTNLRGTVLPVVDLHRRFDLPVQDATKDSRIIVAESSGNKIGMMVDAVLEVRRVAEAAIEPPSPLVATIDSAFITGIAKVGDERLIILLDLERVLARE
jgi:purine-binding chemotaxis protein CheW